MSDDATPATSEEIEENTFVQGLYSLWLQARALYQAPIPDGQDDSDALVDQRSDAADEAARQLLVKPAIREYHVWYKWEVLEFFIDSDARDGQASDARTIAALGCI